ncbi:MAG: hypothetical protein U0136_17390 [Bdellovibrionota bacterium]
MERTTLTRISRLLTALVLVCGGVAFYSNMKRSALPKESDLLNELKDEPEQEEISERAFVHKWRGQEFVVHPVADYSITGLLVSRNDIGGFADIYHTSNSVDVVDVCLIWGANARERVYKNVQFGSEPFSCWYRDPDGQAMPFFHPDQLSNTHVLAKDESLGRRLSGLRIGDQIRMSGRLVNYNPAGASEMLRKSSLVRTDAGDGACEVMFVESLEVLKRGNPGWNDLFDAARLAFLVLLVLKISSALVFPYLEYRLS